MINEKKFIKRCEIGEKKFVLGINRAIALKGFKEYPEYWEYMTKAETFSSIKGKEMEDLSIDEWANVFEARDLAKEYAPLIVDFIFADMLEYGESKLPENISNYKEYAKDILEYCNEVGVLYAYENEEGNSQKGVYDILIEFITQGFTSGGEKKKKSAVKVIMN